MVNKLGFMINENLELLLLKILARFHNVSSPLHKLIGRDRQRKYSGWNLFPRPSISEDFVSATKHGNHTVYTTVQQLGQM